MCVHRRSNYTHTHTQKQSPAPCGCDPMTLLSHTVPICHREAQREVWRDERGATWIGGRLDLGAKCSQCWGCVWGGGVGAAAQDGTEGDKECAFMVHFGLAFAQMCREVSAVFSRPRWPTPPHPALIVPPCLNRPTRTPHPFTKTTQAAGTERSPIARS